jgi:SNF2 family DNA or RNA helicase
MNYICLDCFIRNYQITKKCPYCRTTINSTNDINFLLENLKEEKEKEIKIPDIKNFKNLHNYLKDYSKFFNKEIITDLIIDNIKKINKNYKILIFSSNNNFTQNLNNKIIKISKNIQNIEKIITNYNENNSILFMDSKYFNYGFNLEKTTHLIITHKLNPIIEKQVISRAYRIGRKNDLNIYHLLHKNE